MKKTIQKYIKSNILFSPSDKIIVGVSGGADSVALLDVLLSLGYKCIVAHCNFHLRKEESIRDEIFVRELSQTYNCTFHKIDFQTKEYALEKKISIEMAARELRYDWFEEIRKKEKANCIAIAHHKDDIVETLLMNLTRGTGVNGLTGIKAKKGYIVRPMLCVCKKDVLNYLNEKGLSYMYDSSNGECDFTRNKFRNIIIPMFESINPSFKESIIETTQILNDVGKIYQEYLNKKIENIVQQKDETTYISIENLKKEPIIKSLLFEILKNYGFNASQCYKIAQNLDSISGKKYATKDFVLIKDRDFLIINKKKEIQKHIYTIDENECETTSPLCLKLEKTSSKNIDYLTNNKNIAFFDLDKITFPLQMRKWHQGDYFYPLGMKNKKKLSDFFIDNKYTITEKKENWILCSNNQIIWIVGQRLDDRFKITAETKNILKISILDC